MTARITFTHQGHRARLSRIDPFSFEMRGSFDREFPYFLQGSAILIVLITAFLIPGGFWLELVAKISAAIGKRLYMGATVQSPLDTPLSGRLLPCDTDPKFRKDQLREIV